MTDNKPILVVDDNAPIQTLFTRVLAAAGHRVLVASDGAEALEILDGTQVAMVVTDVNMPRVDGITLLRHMRSRLPHVPVILITAKPSLDAAVDCIKLGATDYLPKPVDIKRFLEIVRKSLAPSEPLRANSGETVELSQHLKHAEEQRGLGKYRTISCIGRGNMGVVLLAEREVDGVCRKYAVKIIKPEALSASGEERRTWIRRFQREAEAISRIKHPHVMRVIESDVLGYDQAPYLVMEYCTGQPLNEWAAANDTGGYRPRAAIIRQMADALSAVHEQGMSHGDVKPENILVSEDLNSKLIDFGSCRSSDAVLLTSVIGTPAYMAPELFEGEYTDLRADIFSLGVVAYELFLGERPFKGDTLASVMREIRDERPRAPRAIDPEFPDTLETILARALSKQLDGRYGSAAEMTEDLDAFLAQDDSLPERPGCGEDTWM
jgi:serine/threonine protein kinase